MSDPVLNVERLMKYFPVMRGLWRRRVGAVRAVDDVSLTIRRGETLGLVGESGSGKTTLGRAVLHLLQPDAGTVRLCGRELGPWLAKDRAGARRHAQIIFQDPFSALDPRQTVGQCITEGLAAHDLRSSARRQRVTQILGHVGLSAMVSSRYPHELSGGERQRVGIARAVVGRPAIVVCDEPVSSLDVSVQAQVLELLAALQQEFAVAYLFITHDLSVAFQISHRISVMHQGRFVETGSPEDLLARPKHPYTKRLLEAVPRLEDLSADPG